MKLTTVQKALEEILNQTENFGVESINFLKSDCRVLKEDICADRSFPPFSRVSMDGIAISEKAFNEGQRAFEIEGIQPAGSPQLTMQNSNNCIEVMTGAILPKNTDVVIQYELVEIENGIAKLQVDNVRRFQNVHLEGLDRKKGDILIKEDTVISPAEIGVLATVGKRKVKVAKQPKVMIVSTGNELVAVSDLPEPYQIRRSNVFTLVSLLKARKIQAETAHIVDDKEELQKRIGQFLNDFDVLIFSGAVSKGKFDFIPEVLNNLGVEKLFHKVKQRPGKPFWFGKKGDKTVFAFPGNPVSTFVSCLKYFYPWYRKSMGLSFEKKQQAILAEDYSFKPELTYFLQVKLHQENGQIMATPVTGKGSGDLANLVDSDAFLELPDDRTNFTKGEIFPILRYRSF